MVESFFTRLGWGSADQLAITGFSPRGYGTCWDKQNTANGVLYFCTLNGRKYVVKEFTSFRYQTADPSTMSDPVRRKYDAAMAYYAFLKKATDRLHTVSRMGGMLNIPMEVFLQDGHVCKVSRFVEHLEIEPEKIRENLSVSEIDQLMKSALLQLDQLKQISLVHGDLKPDNLMVCRYKNRYLVALIDYDGGFFEQEPPEGRDINFTPGYAAPEVQDKGRRISSSEMTREQAFNAITCAADIFSLACIWLCFLNGQTPGSDGGHEDYYTTTDSLILNEMPYAAPVRDPVRLHLIAGMLSGESARRPEPRQILEAMNQAEQAGLLQEADHALQDTVCGCVPEGEIHQPVPGIAYREAGNGSDRFGIYLLSHVFSATDPQGNPLSAWNMAERENRFRNRQDLTAVRVRECAQKNDTILPYTLSKQGRLYYALQPAVPGERIPLEQVHTRTRSLRILDAMMVKLLNAADELHRNGLVFGNLTKENIIIASLVTEKIQADGSVRHVRRFDVRLGGCFYLFSADQVPEPEEWMLDASLNSTEVANYRATQRQNDRPVYRADIGPGSDVFSLGLIYHILLTGHLPDFESRFGYYYSARGYEEDTNTSSLDESVGAERAELIRRMTAFRPGDRIGSCAEAVRCIREFSGA